MEITREVNLHDVAAALANEWRTLQQRDVFTALYLYHRPSACTGRGAITVACDAPSPDYELSNPERICPSWPIERVKYFIYETIRALPILPLE